MKAALSFQKKSSPKPITALFLAVLVALTLVPLKMTGQTTLWSEDFEGGSMPSGWTTSGSGSWSVATAVNSTHPSSAGHGSYCAQIKHGTTGNATKLITPSINLSGVSSAELSFMHVEQSWSGDIDGLNVYYRTSSSGSWTSLTSYTSAYPSWTTETGIALPNLSSTYQLAFEYIDNYGYGLGIDNIIIVQGASCPKPASLAVSANGQSATITWTGTASSYSVVHSTSASANPDNLSATTVNNASSYTANNLTIDADHYFWVRANCDGSDGSSTWAGPVSVHIGYCQPAFSSTSDYITDFAVASINNSSSGFSTGGYGNFSNLSTTLAAGSTVTASLTSSSGSGTHAASIWIDFNNNLVFEDSERVGTKDNIGASTTVSIDLTIPNDAAAGNHRMRVVYQYNVSAANISPCASASYGEGEDYTVIVPAPCPAPTLTSSSITNITTSGATVSWSGGESPYTVKVTQTIFSYDFESATPWVVDDFSPCTTYDGDGGKTYAIDGSTFDNQYYYGSFIAFQNGVVGDFTAHGGNAFGVCMASGASGTTTPNNDFFILPEMTIPSGSTFSFWARSANDTYGLERFKVGVYGGNGSLTSYLAGNASSYIEAPTAWTQYSYDLSAYAGQTIRLAINCVSDDAFSFWIDDISVISPVIVSNISGTSTTLSGLEAGTTYEVQVQSGCGAWSNTVSFATTESNCRKPTNLTFISATTNSATISWSHSGEGDTWQYSLNDGDWITFSSVSGTTTKTATISGLTPFTSYSVRVRTYCSNSEQSNPSDALSFQTAPDVFCGGTGTADDPYLLCNADQVNSFANVVNSGWDTYGKYFKLDDNYDETGTVTTPIGTNRYVANPHPFKGTFDGNEKTMKVNISITDGQGDTYQGAAPFRYISSATIQNLAVTGEVTATAHHASGLVGHAEGTNTIQNCLISTNVTNNNPDVGTSTNNYIGGIIGHNLTANTSIIGCVYNGTLTSEAFKGGMIGFANGGATATIKDSYFDGSYSTSTYFSPIGCRSSGADVTLTISNFYYNKDAGNFVTSTTNHSGYNITNTAAKHGYTVSGVGGVSVAMRGTATATYSVSGITAYSTGIVYNGTIYGGNGDNLALSLSFNNGDPGTYQADEGTLTGTDHTGNSDPYTLTMPATNVKIGKGCATPTGLVANGTTISWNGTADSYNVQYYTATAGTLTQGFENGMDGWTMSNTNSSTGINTTSSYVHSGSQCFTFHWTTEPPQYLISPQLNGASHVNFYYKNTSSSWSETFKVGYSTTTNNISAFTWSSEYTASGQQWYSYSENVPEGTKYIAIQCTSNDMYYLAIDDIAITYTVFSDPQTITGVTSPYTFDGLPGDSYYQVQVQSMCDGSGSTWSDPITMETPHCNEPTITNIDVTAHDATVSWSGGESPYTVRVMTTAVFDDFEGYDSFIVDPEGIWTYYDGDGGYVYGDQTYDYPNEQYTGSCIVMNPSEVSMSQPTHSGDQFLAIIDAVPSAIQTGGTTNDWIISPQINFNYGGAITFWAREITTEYGAETMRVLYSTTTNSPSSFIELAEESVTTVTWTQYSYAIPAGAKYVAINCISNDIFALLIDDITISVTDHLLSNISGTSTTLSGLEAGTTYEVQVQSGCGAWSSSASFTTTETCPAPTGLAVVSGSITHNYATVTWTPAQGTEDMVWQYLLNGNPYGFEINDLTYENGQFTGIIRNLHANTTYSVQVQAVCSAEDLSRPSNTVSVTTPVCEAPTNLTVSNIGKRGADISWNANGNTHVTVDGPYGAIVNETVSTGSYHLTGLDPETEYTVLVYTDCGSGDASNPIEETFTTLVACPAPTGLEATDVQPTSATIAWDGTGADYLQYGTVTTTATLMYDDGTWSTDIGNQNENTWTWGVMYPADQLDGLSLTKISLYETSYHTNDFIVKIYNGGDNAPGTLLYTQTVTPIGTGWHEVDFDSQVAIDPDQNLWITLTTIGTYVLPACTSSEPNNNWVDNGGTWAHIGDLVSSLAGYGWMIRAGIGNVSSWSDQVLEMNPLHTLNGLQPETFYAVRVQAFCGDQDGYSAFTTTTFTTPSNCAAPTLQDFADITTESAIASWTGYHETYEVRYAAYLSEELKYDNGTWSTDIGNTPESTWTWGVMYPADQVNGSPLTRIAFYENSYYTNDVIVNIYNGGDNAPGTLLHTETVSPSGSVGFHEVTFASSVTINPDQNLWITLTTTGTYVVPACTSSEPNNNWVDNGGTWAHVGDLASSLAGFGWMIRGYIEDRPASSVVWHTLTNQTSPAALEDLDEYTNYTVQVRGNYSSCDGGHTPWSTPATFRTLEKCPHPTDLTVDRVGFTTAKLSWTNHGDATDWIVYYGTSEDPSNGTQVTVTGEPTTTLTCLEPGTYYAYVVADCGNDGLSAGHSNTVSFTIVNRPSGTVSDNLTVYDGTATSSSIPMYGGYFDDFTKTECIIPADQLAEIAGSTITSMTFYASSVSSGSGWSGSNQKVFLKEVNSTTLNGSYSGMDGATIVFDGLLTLPTAGAYTINFTTDYTYHGGNLLIGVYNDDDGNYNFVYWYGVSGLSSGVSAYGYNGSSLASASYSAQTFLPKTTFAYTLTVDMDAELAGEIESGSAQICRSQGLTIASEDDGEALTYRWKNGNSVIEGATGASYTILPGTLQAGTTYTFTREAKDECVTTSERWVPSTGSYTVTVTAADPYDAENDITADTVYCGFDGVWAAPHNSNYQHRWYADAACTGAYYTGDTVTLPQLTQTTTLWHTAQEISMGASTHTFLEEHFNNGKPSEWGGNFTYDSDGYVYGPQNNANLITPAMDLSNAGTVTLSFRYRNPYGDDYDYDYYDDYDYDYDLLGGYTSYYIYYDYYYIENYFYQYFNLNVYYSVDDGDWQMLSTITDYHDEWTEQSVVLPNLGSNCRIKFEMDDNGYYVVSLDDIKVAGSVIDPVGCPTMPMAHEVFVKPHPVPDAPDKETYCGLPVTLEVQNPNPDFQYQWSSNPNFTDTLSLATDTTVTLPTGSYSYFVRSYKDVPGEQIMPEEYCLQEDFSNGIPDGWTGEFLGESGSVYGPQDNATLITPAMDLNNTESALLTFKYKNPYDAYSGTDYEEDYEEDYENYGYYKEYYYYYSYYYYTNYYRDYYNLKVYYSVEGSEWQLLSVITDSKSTFTNHSLTLPNLGANYRIKFEIDDNGNSNSLLYLDDIAVSHRKYVPEISCSSEKEVKLTVLPAPKPEVSDTSIVCGDNVTLEVQNPIEGYTYDWAVSGSFSTSSIIDNPDNETLTTDPIWITPTTYYVRSHPDIYTDECMSSTDTIVIRHKPIGAPTVSDTTITCGTPAVLRVVDIPEEMGSFTYHWTELHGTLDSVGNTLTLYGKDNIDKRTIYVQGIRINGDDIGCTTETDTIHISLQPISGLTASIWNSDDWEAMDPTDHVCEGTTLSLQGENYTRYADPYDHLTPIPTYAVWYRRAANSTEDSTLYCYSSSEGYGVDPYYDTVADQTGTWQYYVYAATHLISDMGENSVNTLRGASTFDPASGSNYEAGSITFEVTADVPIVIDTLWVFPAQNATSTTVKVYVKPTEGADPTQDRSQWQSYGSYTINMNGNSYVPFKLSTPIQIPGHSTYSFFLYSQEHLLYDTRDESYALPYTFHDDRDNVTLKTGYYMESLSNPLDDHTSTATVGGNGRFLGKLHYTYSSGDRMFGCMSTEVSTPILIVDVPSTAPDTLMVAKASPNDPDLTTKRDGLYVCNSASGLVLSTTTTTFGDHAKYVWLVKTDSEDDYTVLDSTLVPELTIQVPDESATLGVHIASDRCGATDWKYARIYVSEVPEVAAIQFGPLCAPTVMSEVHPEPAVTDDGQWIESRSWQISPDGAATTYTDISATTDTIRTSYNGWYVRYRATTTNGCTEGYSTVMKLYVDTASYFLPMDAPEAICAGDTFGWTANTPEAVVTNNSGREVTYGYNFFLGGQLTDFDPEYHFTYRDGEPNYYQYNRWVKTACDSVVSDIYTIPVWAIPSIIVQLPERNPVEDCEGYPVGHYFQFTDGHNYPDYDDHGSTDLHGWEIADMMGSNDWTVLSDGQQMMDDDVILTYDMNGKVLRYYVENQCGHITTTATLLTIQSHPTVGELAEMAPVCDGTPFAPTAPEVTDDGGIYRYTTGWYLSENGVITDTVTVGDPMMIAKWDGKVLQYGVTNNCGTGFSNGVKIYVNPLPDFTIVVSRDNADLEGTEFCFGPEYGLKAVPADPDADYTYEWSDELGADNVVDLGQLEEGDYTYTLTATDNVEETHCSATATITFAIRALTYDTVVTVCEADLPYVFDTTTCEAEGRYEIHYPTSLGCDSVVVLTLNVNHPLRARTTAYICNGQTYEWTVEGVTRTYGEGLADTVITDTVKLAAVGMHSDVTAQYCDSIIYTLHLSISDEIYIDLPQGDEFTVAVGEQVNAEANVRGGCSDENAKTAIAFQLFKDEEPVDLVGTYGQLNLSTYLPVQHTTVGLNVTEGSGEIPATTFDIQYYNYDYFYSFFFGAIDNRITAVWNEPGDYRLQMVLVRKTGGHDFPMTYRYSPNAEPGVMGGSNGVSTGDIFSDTVNIWFHVDGEPEVVIPDEPTASYTGDLDIDTVLFTEVVNEASSFDMNVTGDPANAPTKLAIDYQITRNGEVLDNVSPYGSVNFTTDVPRMNRSFGRALTNGTGSIPQNTFSILYYEYDFFYNHFIETAPSHLTTQWFQPGVYEITFTLRERTAGQDIPLTYSNETGLYMGGHGSGNGAVVATKTLVFNVAAETVEVEINESICEDALPYIYNGHEFYETGEYTYADASGVYDTLYKVTIDTLHGVYGSVTAEACNSYEWNGEEYTVTGIYTYEYPNDNGCMNVDTLHLTIVTAPVIRITARESVCEGADLPVSAQVIYAEGFDNMTEVSFTQVESRRDTVDGEVTVRYDGTLSQLTGDADIYVTSTNSVGAASCLANDTAHITVVPLDTIADFTASVCQGEPYVMSEEGWAERFAITSEQTTEAIVSGNGVIYDTIVTGTSSCGTYRAALILTVNPTYDAQNPVEVTDNVCEGYDYQGNGFVLTAEEIANQIATATANIAEFTHTGETVNGCDSVTVLRLTVLPTARYEYDKTACGIYYDERQRMYTESGAYTDTLVGQAVNGCDSIVTMHLTLYQPTEGDTTAVACDRFEWYEFSGDNALTQSGDYTHVFIGGNADGCDSTVTLHLTVNHSTNNSYTAEACDRYVWEGHTPVINLTNDVQQTSDLPTNFQPASTDGTYTQSGTYLFSYENEEGCPSTDTLHLTINTGYRVTDQREVTSAELPVEWNGLTFTAATTDSVTLTAANGCDSTVVMTLTVSDVTGTDPFMTVNGTGDTVTLTAFANQAALDGKVSIDYHLYKDGALVEDVDYECGGRLYIGTEFQGLLYGADLAQAEGNVPGNTFHISNYHYEFFYWAFFNGRANTVTHTFTKAGTYEVVFELRSEEGGQDFALPYDNDYTHRIGGKNSLPVGDVLATKSVTFSVNGESGDDTPSQATGPVMTLSTATAEGSTPVTMGFTSNDYDNEKVSIRYTVCDENEEPLPMLSSVGSIRITTTYNNTEYGDNLTEVTGFVPEATFHPVSRYYNYFYMGFLATTHNTITATWTVPGTYKIKFELVQMTGGQDFPLTYGTDYKKLGGKNAVLGNAIYDTKWLTCTSGNATQNPVATGIADNDVDGDGFTLYPNPARDRAVLTLGKVAAGAYIVITDVNGKEVYRAEATDSRMEFNVATWSEGVYFVTLRDDSQTVTKKLVVTK